MLTRIRAAAIALFAVLLLGGCGDSQRPAVHTVAGGDAVRGRELMRQWGCGSCHVIPGIRGADALVGPPLNAYGQRAYVAGMMPNNGENLTSFLMNPQAARPGTAMPDLGLTDAAARDMAAYLLSLGR
jgi:cytochrome c